MTRNVQRPRIRKDEQGHAMLLPGSIIAAVGAVLLGIGAANDTGMLAVIGGIVIAVGLIADALLQHMIVDYDVYARLEKLEKK
jgi:drug/metabolite transporter superfamily protein YnfA